MAHNPRTEESLFVEALEKPTPEERGAFLDAACGDDVVLRQRVEHLLASHEQAGSFLHSLPTTHTNPVREGPGSVIGPYKLLQQIGQGGMGVVYLAEQQVPVRRRVALKIIKPGMDSAQVIARFEAERQALALMDHQNIARVLDAGTTPTGRPFFVMELVHGVPITKYCDENKLPLRDRLALLVPVCQAVQHAHQKGIIHRDLKPSNILVTHYDGRPAPKVIDFGVAKAIEQRLTERTLFTQYGTIVGTLEYVSPEQAEMSALGVDTRSDVYSLGVVMYELLTGTTPLERARFAEAGYGEMLRLIKEEEPPRPSLRLSGSGQALATISQQRGTEPARLTKLVRGELDWIVMKALEKDRTRRYESATGLARDLERYLNDEAVEACPPSTTYKVRKFARKHRVPILAGLAFAGLLLLGTMVSTWQAIRASMAEAAAAQALQEALHQQEHAHKNEQLARDKERLAQSEREKAERILYASRLNLAQAAWEANNVGQTGQFLEQQRPKAGEPDLRGFEWYYWKRQLHADLRTVQLPTGYCWSAALSRDATCLATLTVPTAVGKSRPKVQIWDAQQGMLRASWWLDAREGSALAAEDLFLSPDGAMVALVRRGGPIPVARAAALTIWQTHTGKELGTRTFPDSGRLHLAFRPDGKQLALAVGWTTVRIFDIANLETPVRDWHASAQPIQCLAFSPDGRRLAVGSRGQVVGGEIAVSVWDVNNGAQLLAAKAVADNLSALTFSPDGKRLGLSTMTYERNQVRRADVRIWEAATGNELVNATSVPGEMLDLAFSHDGKRLAGWGGQFRAGDRSTVHLWDVETGKLTATLKGHTEHLRSVAFTRNGSHVVSAGTYGGVKTWDPAALEPLSPSAGPKSGSAIVPSPLGTSFAEFNGDRKKGVVLRDSKGTKLVEFNEHSGEVLSLAYNSDGQRIASLDQAEVIVWDPTSGAVHGRLKLDVTIPVVAPRFGECLAFSADGKRLVANVSHQEVLVWDVESGKLLARFHGPDDFVAISPDGSQVITRPQTAGKTNPSQAHQLRVWDVATGQVRFRLEHVGTPNKTVAFSPDGRRIAGITRLEGTAYKDLRIWDAATGAEQHLLRGHVGTIAAVAFSPDGTRLAATGFTDQTFDLKLWDPGTGKELWSVKEHGPTVRFLAFTPDGRRLATAIWETSAREQAAIRLWDTATGREVLSLPRTLASSGHLAFSPDGTRLITAVNRATWPEVWDATPLPTDKR